MSRHHWRRRRHSAAPLVLAIVDHDTKRFTVEGLIENDDPWVTEISRANKAGRNIDFLMIEKNEIDDAIAGINEVIGYDQWPPKSIIFF